jgi:hypothetical protein
MQLATCRCLTSRPAPAMERAALSNSRCLSSADMSRNSAPGCAKWSSSLRWSQCAAAPSIRSGGPPAPGPSIHWPPPFGVYETVPPPYRRPASHRLGGSCEPGISARSPGSDGSSRAAGSAARPNRKTGAPATCDPGLKGYHSVSAARAIAPSTCTGTARSALIRAWVAVRPTAYCAGLPPMQL